MHTFGKQLHNKAIATRHRLCIVLSGSKCWGEESAQTICAQYPQDSIIHVSNCSQGLFDDTVKPLKISQAKQTLGKEITAVVYDCFSGFDPDAVGILGGAIKAGGLMVLIAPELPLWSKFDDPQFEKITAYGNPKPEFSYYIKRLIRIISASQNCILVEQHKPLPPLSTNYQTTLTNSADFSDQNQAIESIKHVVYGQRRRPAILLSDRGRGKSAALGIAAGQLLQSKVKRIGVTGNSKQSVANVFMHAAATHNIVADSLCFYPPDKLIESKPDIDLLLIDEAASIPLPMLGRILEIFPRIAFASTVHGYEGTGRGFILRFKELIERHCRGSKICTLSTPIRWAQDDPLESFLFEVLLLDAEPTEISPSRITKSTIDTIKIDTSKFEFGIIEKSDLAENEPLTREVFGLLTQAHYRTRPYDLRRLLDATNIKLFGIYPSQQLQQKQIIGVAVVAIEGGFDHETANKIWANQSRPKGHLLPELLCAQQGFLDAAKLKTARIMRIVVRPEFQRHGIGKSLLTHIFNFYDNKVDLLGTTFGANLAVLQFWLDSKFMPIRIGNNQSRNSAAHACAMIKPISPHGKQLAKLAENKFADNFRHQLRAVFPSLEPALVPVIYRSMANSNELELDNGELTDLVGFAFANQNMDNILVSLIRLTEITLRSNSLSHDNQQEILMVERILLGKSWKNCTALSNPKGKKLGVAELRKIVSAILMQSYPKQIKQIQLDFDIK